VRENLANRHLLLIGVTGFIGKVWLVDLLENIPTSADHAADSPQPHNIRAAALRKFVEESPTFDTLQERHGRQLGAFLEEEWKSLKGM